MLSKIQFNIEENVNHIDSAHRIFCIDVSGSMFGELADIRRQLKNKIPTAIRENDYMTLIWFSGKGQFGTIFEHISINDLKDLSNINSAIDRYLKTVGLTGFVEPIKLAKKLAETYIEQPQVFFLTDGGENSWNIHECEKAFEDMKDIPLIIVEYQYYCDRVFLQKLADLSNAVTIFNENFESYDVSFDSYMKNKVSKMKTVESGLPIIYIDNGTFVSKMPTAESLGMFRIPMHVDQVWKVDSLLSFEFPTYEREKTDVTVNEVYLTMLYALQTKQPDLMEKCINVLGDVYITKQYSVCFSKQDKSRLFEHIMNCVIDPNIFAFKEGVNIDYKVDDNAFTIVDLLQLIQGDEKSLYYAYHPSVNYNRISKEIKDDENEFIPNRDLGSSFNLVYHQSRANISLGCQVLGHEKNKATEVIKPITAFRNYTIVKDGIKNMDTIAVSFSEETYQKLKDTNLFAELGEHYQKDKVYVLNLKNLPVVNRKFAKVAFTSVDFCQHHVELHAIKSQMKYVKKMIQNNTIVEQKDGDVEDEKQVFERKKADPSVVRDFYMAPELQVKIAKCSSIPTVNEKLLTKLEGPEAKLTLSEFLMYAIHAEYKCQPTIEQKLNWLYTKQNQLKQTIHELTTYLEQAKMALLIGGCWFSNCTVDTKTFMTVFESKQFEVTIEINDIHVYMS